MFWPRGYGLAVAPGDADDECGDSGDDEDCLGGNGAGDDEYGDDCDGGVGDGCVGDCCSS